MATTTWGCNKDTTTADNGTSLGAGAMDYLPVGNYAGYDYRAFLGFAYSFAGMVSITTATLWLKTSSQVKVAFGSSPDLFIQRTSAGWTEGTASSLSSTNATERSNEPGVTGAIAGAWRVSTTENTWVQADITVMMQQALAAGVFYGLRLVAATSSSSDVTEFYSREYGSNDAYIVITYTTNTIAQAPTLTAPTNGVTGQSLTPTLAFTHVDSDGDALLNYDLQVSTDSTFASVTHWNISAQTTGITGNNVSRVYAGTALSNNVTYYWRARTGSSTGITGVGAWSATRSFKTAQLPVVTLTEPTVDATKMAKLTFTAGSGWASPRLNVGWTFSCPDGGTQTSYQVFIEEATTSGGSYSTWHDTGTVSSTATSLVDATTVTNGNYYKVKVRATCSHGQTSVYTGTVRARAAWAVALHRFDCTSAPVSWSIGSIATTTAATTSVVIEYGSNSTTSTPGTFYASMSSLTLNRYFFYRAYLLGYGASPVTMPSLDKLVLTYSSAVLVPDHWTRSDTTNETLDTATARSPGSKSLKMVSTGANHAASQQIDVQPNTDYVLSAMVKTQGSPVVTLGISTGSVTGNQVTIDPATPIGTDMDWSHVRTLVWNSGSATSMYVTCRLSAGSGTVWFDDVKLEAATVATPFSVGSHRDEAVVDGGGIQVDTASGGIFRVRSSDGKTVLKSVPGSGIQLATSTDQATLLTFATDRPWSFIQNSTGANTTLDLKPTSDQKAFRIMTADGLAVAMQVTATNGVNASTFSAPLLRQLWLPIVEAGLDSATLITTGATPNLMRALNLADAATQGAYWEFAMPLDATSGGAWSVAISWSPSASDAVAHTVRWNPIIKNVSSGVDITGAGVSFPFTGSSAARTINVSVADASGDFSGSATLTPGARYRLLLQRIGADAADTYVGAVRVYNVIVQYQASR